MLLILLLLAVAGTLYAQAQPGGEQPPPPRETPGSILPGTPAAQTQAQPGTGTPQLVQPGAPQSPSQAQEQEAQPQDNQGYYQLSENPLTRVKEFFMFSPIINGIILGLSVLGLLFFFAFMLTINRRTMVPHGFVDEVVKLVVRGDYERAGDVCRRARGVFAADIIQRCIENHKQQHSVMLDMIDTEGRRLADIIWNRVSYLADISNVAPMLGLVGTVLGMIKAFYGLQQETGTINAMVLSRGVGEAMGTTLFGLSVGIVMLVLYSVVKSRATRTLADAEAAVHRIADHIKRGDDEPDPRAAMEIGRQPLR
ncbi:MAG: MotA/TolQ/ExbB proton channel family protein [Planctomycetota bacterium]